MLKFVKKIIVFSLFSLLAYIVLVIFWGTLAPTIFRKNINFKMGGPGHMFTRLREADTIKNVDILFLGSSHAYRGYDPRIFNQYDIRTFNLGSSAQTPIETKILVDNYLDKIKPRHVVFDVFPVLFGNDGVESLLDIISNMKDPGNIYPTAIATKNAKVYNALIYNTYATITNKKYTFREPISKGNDTYISGGYVETKRKNYVPEAIERDYNQPILPKQIAAFEEIIEELRRRNISFTLVQAPITQRTYHAYRKNNEMDEFFRKYGTYYNYNELLQIPDSLFFDDSHMVQQGVELFNQKLIVQLMKDGILNARDNEDRLTKE